MTYFEMTVVGYLSWVKLSSNIKIEISGNLPPVRVSNLDVVLSSKFKQSCKSHIYMILYDLNTIGLVSFVRCIKRIE